MAALTLRQLGTERINQMQGGQSLAEIGSADIPSCARTESLVVWNPWPQRLHDHQPKLFRRKQAWMISQLSFCEGIWSNYFQVVTLSTLVVAMECEPYSMNKLPCALHSKSLFEGVLGWLGREGGGQITDDPSWKQVYIQPLGKPNLSN